MAQTCTDIAPIITSIFLIEIFFFQILFILIRLMIFGNRNLCCLGIPSTALAILIIIYFQLIPSCENILSI